MKQEFLNLDLRSQRCTLGQRLEHVTFCERLRLAQLGFRYSRSTQFFGQAKIGHHVDSLAVISWLS